MVPAKELKVFYSYSHEDKQYRQQLENHLVNLKRLYHLQTWFDRQIKPGDNWEDVLEDHLNSADLIFLLISPDFMSSDYCYNKEMTRALERHTRGEAKVIPIIVRYVHWKNSPFSHIQVLPTDARPIKSWNDPDEAFYDVTNGVEKVVRDLLALRKTKEDTKSNTIERYNETPAANERAIGLDFNSANDYIGKAIAHRSLKEHDKALIAYEQAILLDANSANAYIGMGNTLNELKRYNEALAASEQAILLDPYSPAAYRLKGKTLNNLKRYQEAEEAYQKARELE